MRDLIFISLENWDDIWRRNQFVCAELAGRHPGRRILFVTPPRDVSHAVRRGKWEQLRRGTPWSPAGLPNIVVFTPTKWFPNSLAAGRWVNQRGLRRQLIAEQRRLSLDEPVLWINDHAASHLVGRLGESAVVYDITDDWISFDVGALQKRTREQDAELRRRADAVIVCSQRLRELKQPLMKDAGRLHLIPNGVHAEHYAKVMDRSLPIPAVAEGWERPVCGYTGTIHGERVDVDLVERIAGRMSSGTLVFIGPDHLSREERNRLLATGRVVLHPAVPYREIPNYMRAFDVLVVPHRKSEFVESLNPIKLWEYLAAGKPIVSTNVAGFRDHPQFVRIAETAEDFVREMRAPLTEDPATAIVRREEARRSSWASRVDQIERVIEACLAGRGEAVEQRA